MRGLFDIADTLVVLSSGDGGACGNLKSIGNGLARFCGDRRTELELEVGDRPGTLKLSLSVRTNGRDRLEEESIDVS